jgi:hypothetical protein
METKTIRKPRAYKIEDRFYVKAQKRASTNVLPLATLIEQWVKLYSKGHSIGIVSSKKIIK